MKAIMQSIQPKWCELIANSKKTVEVRKTRPKIETPFKVYMYCTRDKNKIFWHNKLYQYIDDISHNLFDKLLNGKVIGEYVCYGFDEFIITKSGVHIKRFLSLHQTSMSVKEMLEYAKGRKTVYGYRISNLVIYDEPKELGNFMSAAAGKPLTRPPQSWCYVEEIKTNE